MAYLQHNQIGFKDVGKVVTVPGNDTARLMYYLDCACNAVNYTDNNISRYRNYSNWAQLSSEDIRMLIVLCYTLSPDIFDNKVFFHSDALCGNMGNKFWEINQVRNQLLVAESIVIAGRSCRVNKIMTYKMSWMTFYYFTPIQNLAQRLNKQTRSSTCVIS
jgi:hypothetical protein